MEAATIRAIQQIQNDLESIAFEVELGFNGIHRQLKSLNEQIKMMKMTPGERTEYSIQSVQETVARMREKTNRQRNKSIQKLIERSRQRLKEL